MPNSTTGQAKSPDNGFLFSGFSLSEREFEAIRVLVKQKTGISLCLHKQNLVISRLSRRLRTLGLQSFTQYIDLLQSQQSGDELIQMINRITTNRTEFFRERHHFDFMSQTLLPAIYERGESSGERKLRVWSAGCSSGEEPYSMAIILNEFFENRHGWDIKILASDLDTSMLQKASKGVYEATSLEPVPPTLVNKYFSKQAADERTLYQVKPAIRDLITFRRFNLMDPVYPLKIKLDFIFCRNVLIYFDNNDKIGILNKFHQALAPDGYLFVGHSESLMMASHLFTYAASTVYRKK